MVGIKWCLKVKGGLELVEPSDNLSKSYIEMAEESLRMIKKNKESRIWLASTSYYTMYYSLYAIMMKLGVKCEIHSCSIEFMKKYLLEFYNNEYIKTIESAFEIRNDLQYYPDRLVDESKLNIIENKAPDFFVKTKNILAIINEMQVSTIRKKLEERRDDNRQRNNRR